MIQSPALIPEQDKRVKIFLAGSIDMGRSENWQKKVIQQLAGVEGIILNPRRDDWDKSWKPVSTDTNFRRQVEWELDALEKADMILMYFEPASQSPITLLELGLYARSKKIMVVCPEGFWRKGNVDIVCERYGIKQYKTVDEMLGQLKKQLQ
ncbi:hypothetical protein A8C56_23130 [Niabella ginsenosidivorans]|uniref:Nucleoside 2-deoxyribosyltransferase n=1 Tax=Niabella ginsenosidivorans TaxID=1176587 RepID=A0A1A9IBQ8_9BACT|nr:hypothetical protein A8C56_23130 [Niabella ginsenosidivorans]